MRFPESYILIPDSVIVQDQFKIAPIRYEDRIPIRKWRNEQIFHLRQKSPLTQVDQDNYFKNVVSKLFQNSKPEQYLFSFYKEEELIGYGGLVHINWSEKKAEISFLMDTGLEKNHFEEYWSIFLGMIETIAFEDLGLSQIFTFSYELRDELYPMLRREGYILSERLRNNITVGDKAIDALIHTKPNPILLRRANADDLQQLFEWANDSLVRENSYQTQPIDIETHTNWLSKKLNDTNSLLLIAEYKSNDISVINFSQENNKALIGISLDKNYRGKGLATKILKSACSHCFIEWELPIKACIKKNNKPSQYTFEKAGFKFHSEASISNIPSLIYYRFKNE